MFKFYNFFKSFSGRNNTGTITVRHRSGPVVKKKYYNYFNSKSSDFKKFRSYVFNNDFTVFSKYRGHRQYAFSLPRQGTHPQPLYTFRPGTFVNNIESYPGSGSKYARALYSKAMLIRRLGTSSILKLPSGEIRRFKTTCSAGFSPNESFVKKFYSLKKAGTSRLLGIRPHVRGCAINPVDHPHGGRTGESRPSVSPWAKLTKGYRTFSKKKRKNNMNIIMSVQALKDKSRNPQKS